MPNWCYTTCVIHGPEAEIERFKQACLMRTPTPSKWSEHIDNGIDFQRIIPMPAVLEGTHQRPPCAWHY